MGKGEDWAVMLKGKPYFSLSCAHCKEKTLFSSTLLFTPLHWHNGLGEVLQSESIVTLPGVHLQPTRPSLPPHFRGQLIVQVVICASDQPAVSRGSHNPLLRFNNLLEQLTELGKTVYFLYYWFIVRGSDSGTAR